MNVKKPVVIFALVNILILAIFFGTWIRASADASSSPVPVYGAWTTVNGHVFFGSYLSSSSGTVVIGDLEHWNNWSLIPYTDVWDGFSPAGNPNLVSPSDSYVNLTFQGSTLDILLNASQPTAVEVGSYEYTLAYYVNNGTEFYTNYRAENENPIINATFANITLSSLYAFPEPNPNFNYEGKYVDPNVSPGTIAWLRETILPCIMWQRENAGVTRFVLNLPNGTILYYYPPPDSISLLPDGNFYFPDAVTSLALHYNASTTYETAPFLLNFSYVETWKYTPLDHYDNSTILHGLSVLSVLPTYEVSLAISDILLAAVLVGLAWTDHEEDS